MKIVLTGDRPSGRLHLGHYAGSLLNRLKIQDDIQYKQYVMIADVQALTDNFDNPQKITDSVYYLVEDYLSVGIDPQKTVIFIQSQIPELTELSAYFMNMVTLGRLGRNPTVKSEIQQKGYVESSTPVGFFCYPISQAADITAFKGELVPAGDDQIPMIEQTNEIVRKFNHIYQTDCLKEAVLMPSDVGRLVGIDGKAKASKSLGNAICLNDNEDEVERKVFSMFTDPNHLHVKDRGQIEGNAVFAYLEAFYNDKEKLNSLKEHYSKGGLGDVEIKRLLNDVLQRMLSPIRERRVSLKHADLCEVLYNGTLTARKIAQNTLREVRNAMGLNYFNHIHTI